MRPLSPEQAAMQEQQVQLLITKSIDEMTKDARAALDSANNALELARDLDPRDPRVLDGLGCVEWRRGNHDLAAYFFEKALKADPNYDRAYVHLALYEELNQRPDSAERLLRTAIKLNPMNFRARNNYAALLLDKGLRHEARKQLQRAVHAGARNEPFVLLNLKQTLRRSNESLQNRRD